MADTYPGRVRAFIRRERVSRDLAEVAVLLSERSPGLEIRPEAIRRAVRDFHAGRIPSSDDGSGPLVAWYERIMHYDTTLPRLHVVPDVDS